MIQQNLKERIFTSLVLLISIFLAFNYNIFLVYLLLIFGVFSFIEFSNLMKKITNSKFIFILTIVLFLIYVFFFCLAILIFFLRTYFLKLYSQ